MPPTISLPSIAALGLLFVSASTPAWGQPASPGATAPAAGQPSAAPVPGAVPPPNAGMSRLLQRTNPRELTLKVNVDVRIRGREERTGLNTQEDFRFDTAALVFPVIDLTAGSRRVGDFWGRLVVDGVLVDDTADLLTGYPAGTMLGKWTFRDTLGSTVQFEYQVPVRTWRTVFDEDAANRIEWPTSWPDEAASTFRPQWYVDFGPKGQLDMTPIKDLVSTWTRGRDPKTVRPVALAKYLAGEVQRMMQVSGSGLTTARTGEVEGMDLMGAPEAARLRRGSAFDMVCVLTAVYRQAGLPARTVIGYEWGGAARRGDAFGRGSSQAYRAWVEFAVPDPDRPGQVVWIPVDIVALRKASSNPRPLDRPWPFFGTHPELDAVVPVAFQFHPPTDVVAHGSPALYGWMVTPQPPTRVIQAIRVSVTSTPQTPETQRRAREEQQPPQR